MFIGKNSGGTPVIHITKDERPLKDIADAAPDSNTIFHSNLPYFGVTRSFDFSFVARQEGSQTRYVAVCQDSVFQGLLAKGHKVLLAGIYADGTHTAIPMNCTRVYMVNGGRWAYTPQYIHFNDVFLCQDARYWASIRSRGVSNWIGLHGYPHGGRYKTGFLSGVRPYFSPSLTNEVHVVTKNGVESNPLVTLKCIVLNLTTSIQPLLKNTPKEIFIGGSDFRIGELDLNDLTYIRASDKYGVDNINTLHNPASFNFPTTTRTRSFNLSNFPSSVDSYRVTPNNIYSASRASGDPSKAFSYLSILSAPENSRWAINSTEIKAGGGLLWGLTSPGLLQFDALVQSRYLGFDTYVTTSSGSSAPSSFSHHLATIPPGVKACFVVANDGGVEGNVPMVLPSLADGDKYEFSTLLCWYTGGGQRLYARTFLYVSGNSIRLYVRTVGLVGDINMYIRLSFYFFK